MWLCKSYAIHFYHQPSLSSDAPQSRHVRFVITKSELLFTGVVESHICEVQSCLFSHTAHYWALRKWSDKLVELNHPWEHPDFWTHWGLLECSNKNILFNHRTNWQRTWVGSRSCLGTLILWRPENQELQLDELLCKPFKILNKWHHFSGKGKYLDSRIFNGPSMVPFLVHFVPVWVVVSILQESKMLRVHLIWACLKMHCTMCVWIYFWTQMNLRPSVLVHEAEKLHRTLLIISLLSLSRHRTTERR